MTILLSRLPNINKSLLPIKIHFLLFFIAIGCGLPFRTVYAKQLGISGSGTGIVFAVMSASRLITNPLFGIFLDKTKKFRLMLEVTVLVVSLSHLAMIFIPADTDTAQKASANVSCNQDDFHIKMVNVKLNQCKRGYENFTCTMNCSFTSLSSDSVEDHFPNCYKHTFEINYTRPQVLLGQLSENQITLSKEQFANICNVDSGTKDYQGRCTCCGMMDCTLGSCNSEVPVGYTDDLISTQFWAFLFLMIVSSACLSASIFIVDTVCYEILGDKREKYGAQRIYGTIGWGIGGLVGGYFNQLFTGNSDEVNYSPCFYLLAGLIVLDTLPLYFVKVEKVKYSPNVWKDAKLLLSQPYVLAYIAMVLFIGILSGVIWNYQFWFLEEIGATQLLLGLSQTVECFIAETPCFLIAGWIIKKFGHFNCNNLTIIFFVLRYVSFYYMYDPWWSLPAGLLHGPTFGFFYASMTSFAKEKAPEGTEATAQAVLSATFEAIGVAIGSAAGGIGFDVWGSRNTMLYAAIASFALLICNVLLQNLVPDKPVGCDTKEICVESCRKNVPSYDLKEPCNDVHFPHELKEPHETDSPLEIKVPYQTDPPHEMKGPRETDPPLKTKCPNETDSPLEAKDPHETDHPSQTKCPHETDQPHEMKGPRENDPPLKTKSPHETDQPLQARGLQETDPPLEIKGPRETDVPLKTKSPNETDSPLEAKDPHETDHPWQTKGPRETDQPLEMKCSSETDLPLETKGPDEPDSYPEPRNSRECIPSVEPKDSCETCTHLELKEQCETCRVLRNGFTPQAK